MATLERLVRLGALEKMGGKLPGRQLPTRRIYVTPSFKDWATNKLPFIPETHWGGFVPALDQVISLIRDFRIGKKFDFTEELNFLDPGVSGVWELKTGDVRIFGWFYDLDCYVASIGADANYIKRRSRQRYEKCINLVIQDRNDLDLDPPKFISSTDPKDVIST